MYCRLGENIFLLLSVVFVIGLAFLLSLFCVSVQTYMVHTNDVTNNMVSVNIIGLDIKKKVKIITYRLNMRFCLGGGHALHPYINTPHNSFILSIFFFLHFYQPFY